MIEMFKMVSGAYDKQVMPAVVTAEECFYKTRGQSYKLPRNHNKTWLRQYYFRERITYSWNSLPDTVVEAPSNTSSIQSFERLDKHWRDQELIFNYETGLRLGHKANYELTVSI